MNSEVLIIIAIVAFAAGFVLLRVIKTLRSKTPGCGCGDSGKPCPSCGKKE